MNFFHLFIDITEDTVRLLKGNIMKTISIICLLSLSSICANDLLIGRGVNTKNTILTEYSLKSNGWGTLKGDSKKQVQEAAYLRLLERCEKIL